METTATADQAKPMTLPWRTRIALAVISAVTDTSRRSDGTVNRRLLKVLNIKASPNPKPINGVKTADVVVDPSRDLWFRIFTPTAESSDQSPLPVIVFFHGGGFAYLSADSKAYDAVCRRFARKINAVVVSVNYHLAPEHRYPCQYDDGFDVLKFLDDDSKMESGILPENVDISRCFLAGDSAGANLAHHVAKRASETEFHRLKGLLRISSGFVQKQYYRTPWASYISLRSGISSNMKQYRVAFEAISSGEISLSSALYASNDLLNSDVVGQIIELQVIGLVSIQPFFGGEERTDAEKRLSQLVSIERTDWMWKAFLPEGADRDHEAVNVSGPRGVDIRKLEKFPATIVFVGGLDGLQDWQRRYYEWLKSSGKEAYLVEYPNMVHAFYVFPELPEAAQLISQVKDFIHNHCSND